MPAFDYSPLLADNPPPAAVPWAGYPTHNFVGGHVDRETVPVEDLIAAISKQLRQKGPELAKYFVDSGPQGLTELRDYVARKMTDLRGTPTTPDQVLILSGSLQGLDLVNAALLNPGDTVILEENTYGGMLPKVARRGAKAVGAPLDDDGIMIDRLEVILKDLKSQGVTPKYIFATPTIQNPTGSVMPLERRKALLALAKTYGVPIFEDECYADLVWEGDWPPAIRSLDDSGMVIHIGSFSKTLAPALRLGYMVADWSVLSRVLPLKGDAGTGALEQMLVAEYFGTHFEEHLAEIKPKLSAKLDVLVEAVEREFGTAAEFTRPKGGIFFWMRIPGVDTSALFQAANAQGLQFNPGAEWSTMGADAQDCLRLCFALTTAEEIRDGVAKLAEICRQETGIPARSGNVEHG